MINCQAQKLKTQNNKLKIDTIKKGKGKELLPTLTHRYDITAHVTRRSAWKAWKLDKLGGTIFVVLHLKKCYASIPETSHS